MLIYIDPEARNSKRKLADNRPEEAVVVTSLAEEVPKHVVTNNDRINEEPKTFDNEFSLRVKSLLLATYARGGLILSGATNGGELPTVFS